MFDVVADTPDAKAARAIKVATNYSSEQASINNNLSTTRKNKVRYFPNSIYSKDLVSHPTSFHCFLGAGHATSKPETDSNVQVARMQPSRSRCLSSVYHYRS